MPPRSSSPRLAAIRSDGESVRRDPSLSCSGAPTLPWSHEATTLSSSAYAYSTTGFRITQRVVRDAKLSGYLGNAPVWRGLDKADGFSFEIRRVAWCCSRHL